MKYAIIYPETVRMVAEYEPEDRCILYEAIVEYATTGCEPVFPADDPKRYIWEALKQRVDAAEMVSQKRAAAGGGNRTDKEAKPSKTEQTPTKRNKHEQAEQTRTNGNSESKSNTESKSDTESNRVLVCAEQSSPPVAVLTLVDGTEFGIGPEDAEMDRRAFPAVDVMQEYLRMESWLQANPKNRKTRSGIRKFIYSWLSRAQDRARPERGPVKPHYNAAAELLREVSG